MYKHVGTTEEERQKNLALFKLWWNLKKVAKEELGRVKVKY